MKSGMENAKAKGKKIGQRPTTKEDIPSNYLTHSSCPRQAAPAHGVYPQGDSDPYSRPLSDRGPVACEFSRNSGVGVIKKCTAECCTLEAMKWIYWTAI